MNKNILITGGNGQLGRELKELVRIQEDCFSDVTFHFTNRDSLDITDAKKLKEYIESKNIDSIINCAAYTKVDDAEKHHDLVYRINTEAVKNMAELSSQKGIRLIHISTDYVYEDNKHSPINEEDTTAPQSVYGKSKLAAEDEIKRINPANSVIIRTSRLYSHLGHNFVKTILKLGKSKKELNVVCDQLITPTYAKDLAKVILTILDQDIEPSKSVTVYNYGNEGCCSIYDFAQAIFEIGNIKCKVNPISTEEYPTPAKRPNYSVLSKEKIKKDFNLKIPYWRESLKDCLEIINANIPKTYKIGIIGSGFIASGLAKLLAEHKDYEISGILTRSNIHNRSEFAQHAVLTNSLEDLTETSDLIVECSGDAIYATETIDYILKASIPVVTMNSEFHVTTGSYFVDKGLVTEAEGDQPGVQAILHEEALQMGFKPLVYANIKGFLNEKPTLEDMTYWGNKSNLSLPMVTSFTDGTKVEIEQVLVANGLGAGIIQEGLVKLSSDNMLEGGSVLADKAKELGYPVSDYLLSAKLPAGVFLMVEHDEDQKDSLKYYKLGGGPYYVLERTYHLCHFEIIKTIKRVLNGGGVLLNNSKKPKLSVAAVAKRDLKVGEKIKKGIGSFDVRGTAVEIANNLNHVPIGLLANATIKKEVKEGEKVRFEDIDIPESLALIVWKKILERSK
ncbi:MULTISPECIES: dTDP-4-dehydrorhamnose reductase [unclassified Algibacter]|uniref:dTDP-4-dehydrorhamnose reductase n=1 Tax=unclassified Algibacter TaxID=2615009 RepID=UPI0018EEF576|nr:MULTISPECIES: dTDP-4-dehydrorhamnose reductase [unclassified Algibacter]MCL5130324.1 dTDP-4-dehydrorhamnose reductase [Algibacter sp. L4_22]